METGPSVCTGNNLQMIRAYMIVMLSFPLFVIIQRNNMFSIDKANKNIHPLCQKLLPLLVRNSAFNLNQKIRYILIKLTFVAFHNIYIWFLCFPKFNHKYNHTEQIILKNATLSKITNGQILLDSTISQQPFWDLGWR